MAKEQEEAVDYVQKQIDYFKEQIKFIEAVDSDYYDEEYGLYKNRVKQFETVLNMLKEKDKEIEKALEIAFQYGQIDGDHHKTWVIDQMVRILTGDKYNEFVKEYETDEETGEKEWTWKNGIAP